MPRTLTRGGVSKFEGVQRVFTIAAPAAGTDWVFALPGEGWWRILGVHTTFTTSTAVRNRVVEGQYSLAGVVITRFAASLINTTASSAYDVSWNTIAAGNFTINSTPVFTMIGALPDILLQPGGSFGSFTGNIDVADQWGQTVLLAEQYFSDDYEPERGVWAETIKDLSHHPEFAHIG